MGAAAKTREPFRTPAGHRPGVRSAPERALAQRRPRRFALRRARAAQVILDASAVIAILRREPDAAAYAQALEAASERRISAVNWVQTAVVLDGSRDPVSSRALDELM